eukprot:6193529-Pleurochrysis_carterae.AAC.1
MNVQRRAPRGIQRPSSWRWWTRPRESAEARQARRQRRGKHTGLHQTVLRRRERAERDSGRAQPQGTAAPRRDSVEHGAGRRSRQALVDADGRWGACAS